MSPPKRQDDLEPPYDFNARNLLVDAVPEGTKIFRYFSNKFAKPIFFDSGNDGRFNAPSAEYGVNYAAMSQQGAFAESFLRQIGQKSIAADIIEQKGLTTLQTKEEMTFVKIGGKGLAPIGATAEITSSRPPYVIPQKWSLAVYNHANNFDGISYYSRHDNEELCYAIFNRSKHKFTSVKITKNAMLDSRLLDMLDIYNIGLIL